MARITGSKALLAIMFLFFVLGLSCIALVPGDPLRGR